jgi:prepilin-type N-terminal cleavage/methylation domain-containing protein
VSTRAGFTLIEVLAAVFLTAVVMTIAISFFVELSDATDAAAAKARRGRNALTVLDRVARDLEGAYLLAKPPELDPLLHPWIFVAESHEGDSASDRVRFVTRSHRPRNRLDHGSDIAVVTYLLHPSDDSPGYDLLRAVIPGLPDGVGSEFPSADDERFMVVAENIGHFGLRFMAEEFEWLDDWDSSQLEQSGQLPRAAEIEIAYLPELPEGASGFDDFGRVDFEDAETLAYARQVRIPMQPIDVDAMLKKALEESAETDREDPDDADDADDSDSPLDDLSDEERERLEEKLGSLPSGERADPSAGGAGGHRGR